MVCFINRNNHPKLICLYTETDLLKNGVMRMLNSLPSKRTLIASMLTLAFGASSSAHAADAPKTAPEQDKGKPNIVVIFGDDVGYWNLSTYN